ncbi:MAG: NRDE family protein [Bacteroidota bacterium]
MCLILFSYKSHPFYKLILASNRDEFYKRPTAPLSKWANTNILAGQDKLNNGTWLGITTSGKISAITNYRDMSNIIDNAPSRGLLVSNFLDNDKSPLNYLEKMSKSASDYNGYNLIVGDKTGMYYFSNIKNKIEKLEPGMHGLSNSFLNTPWPKVKNGKKEFERIIGQEKEISIDEIFELLSDTTQPPNDELPDTGVGIEWEKALAPIFIKTEVYGTRASSIITIDNNDQITFIERSFIKKDSGEFETKTVTFNW